MKLRDQRDFNSRRYFVVSRAKRTWPSAKVPLFSLALAYPCARLPVVAQQQTVQSAQNRDTAFADTPLGGSTGRFAVRKDSSKYAASVEFPARRRLWA
jgi:hypothetical protein